MPRENCSVNPTLPLLYFQSLSSSQWQLCFTCQDQLDRAPINKHYSGKMEMRCPSSGLTEDVAVRHFPNSESCVRPSGYLALAFSLGAAAAAGAALEAGSGSGAGRTEWYRLRHLHKNTTKQNTRRIKSQKGTPQSDCTQPAARAHRVLVFFTKALAVLVIRLRRTFKTERAIFNDTKSVAA